MYFSSQNNFLHGIMFHHFHDKEKHKKYQGSISQNDIYKLIKYVGKKNIISPDEFLDRVKKKKYKSKTICLTFDDNLKSQYDVALPVLEDFNIKSFFFIYSSCYEGKIDFFELTRYFRANYYDNILEFYKDFYYFLNKDLNKFFLKNKRFILNQKKKFPIYSTQDIKFRLVRDNYLGRESFYKVMSKLFKSKNFKPIEHFKKLYISKNNLQTIYKLGNSIGLHSHTHPNLMESLNYKNQYTEYSKNLSKLSEIINIPKDEIRTMSHPSGSYNKTTLKILKDLGIELGFKQLMTKEPEKGMKKVNNSSLEIAREDHADIIKKINNRK